MKKAVLSYLAIAWIISAPPAFAQHFAPSNTNFELDGPITVNAASCYTGLSGTTGPNVGTSPSDPHWDHATAAVLGPSSLTPNPSPVCALLPFNSAVFVIDSFNPTGGISGLGSVTGSLYGVDIGSACSAIGPLPITGENTGLSPDSITIRFSGMIGSCFVDMNLAGDGIRFVP